MSDTIFALSSGQGRAGVAVVRLSGEAVCDVFAQLCGKLPADRRATLLPLRDPDDGSLIDKGLCLYFAAPRSFTGEDMGELQVHGGRAVLARLLDVLSRIKGLRPAEAGDFTRRAFLNGKLDLVEVEALGDVIEADTQAQLKLAQRLATGSLSDRAGRWRKELVAAMSLLEAAIDFSDEADVMTDGSLGIRSQVMSVASEIEAVLDDRGRGERLRDGVTVAIAGPPNAGKSTLLNVLARRDAAIVSPLPGTTRDLIEVQLDLGGVPVTLVDMAGLREAADEIEAIGVARARERMARSDLVLWLEPAMCDQSQAVPGQKVLRVATKVDLEAKRNDREIAISALTGEGLPELLERLVEEVRKLAGAEENILITRARQRIALRDCAEELRRVSSGIADDGEEAAAELQAEHLRRALGALGRLVGSVDVEEVLDEIFASFCIGK
ncbi:MAG: tRNA uridine-5-carboxymethylaminomethyl(34) synthesis GTPase MnmE [Hyphomicrobiales bacterium]|nr:tRNA uridine-5-carboxymethylaminomethyl(34) synthesis GTPase MnmE [Hyphomicrobiales bacterium]